MEKKYLPVVVLAGMIVIIGLALGLNLSGNQNPSAIEPLFSQVIAEDETEDTSIYVDIKGAVLQPGVYRVKNDTRVFQIIALAGGVVSNADTTHLNMSALLYDQAMIFVPHVGMLAEDYPHQETNHKTSLTHGSLQELMSLPNIGASTAQHIIDYRETHGPFKTIESIIEVNNIGPATYEAIKDLIRP